MTYVTSVFLYCVFIMSFVPKHARQQMTLTNPEVYPKNFDIHHVHLLHNEIIGSFHSYFELDKSPCDRFQPGILTYYPK